MNAVEGPSRWTPHTTHVLYTQLLPNGDTVRAALRAFNGVFRYLQRADCFEFDSLEDSVRLSDYCDLSLILGSLSLWCAEKKAEGIPGCVGYITHIGI